MTTPISKKRVILDDFALKLACWIRHFVTVTPLKMTKTKIPSQHSRMHINWCGLRGVSLKNREAVFSVLPNLAEISVLNQRDPCKAELELLHRGIQYEVPESVHMCKKIQRKSSFFGGPKLHRSSRVFNKIPSNFQSILFRS